LYALYSGVVFLAAAGLIISPILHRFFKPIIKVAIVITILFCCF
jgi:hypothetical protein